MSRDVLVLGDIMLDRQIHGAMTRIAPESPIPVVLHRSTVLAAGGAANVAVNLASLGTATHLVGIVGCDSAADDLDALLAPVVGLTTCLIRAVQASTTIKTRIACDAQPVLRLDYENTVVGDTYAEADVLMLMNIKHIIASGTVGLIVIADYDKGGISYDLLYQVQKLARNDGIDIYVDCKPAQISKYYGVSLVKPNLKEAISLSGFTAPDVSPEAVAEAAYNQLNVKHLVVTCGANGAVYRGQYDKFTATVPRQMAVDTTGAGDTFMAALADAYVRNYSINTAVARANAAAGCVVLKYGTSVVTPAELEAALRQRQGPYNKIMTLDEAVTFIDESFSAINQVVLANGCFRIIHHGHLNLLKWARKQGDFLVVAINSDDAVRRLKGPDKPCVEQASRAELLAALPYVDCVIIFDDVDVMPVIQELAPSVLVKGDEYKISDVVGAAFVRSYDGRVAFAPMTTKTSSSAFDDGVLTDL